MNRSHLPAHHAAIAFALTLAYGDLAHAASTALPRVALWRIFAPGLSESRQAAVQVAVEGELAAQGAVQVGGAAVSDDLAQLAARCKRPTPACTVTAVGLMGADYGIAGVFLAGREELIMWIVDANSSKPLARWSGHATAAHVRADARVGLQSLLAALPKREAAKPPVVDPDVRPPAGPNAVADTVAIPATAATPLLEQESANSNDVIVQPAPLEPSPTEPAPTEPAPTEPATTTTAPDADAMAPLPEPAPIPANDIVVSTPTAALTTSPSTFTFDLHGRLQVDGFAFQHPTAQSPGDTFVLKRARLEAGGGMGGSVGFYLAGDFAAAVPSSSNTAPQSFLATTDDYIYLKPFGNNLILQVGQYDAPLTFENRTSDTSTDFMERSLTVRSFAIPSNKELGAMLHGTSDSNLIYYAIGAFNGDGSNMRDIDSNVDLMGRAFVMPFVLTDMPVLKRASLGGSARFGERNARNGLQLPDQTTQGGFTFFSSKFGNNALYAGGDLRIYALEINLPIDHHWGLRSEYVLKRQGVSAGALANGQLTLQSAGSLNGNSFYVEAWYWLLGDDTILDEAGREIPGYRRTSPPPAPLYGVMLTLRGEALRQDLTFATALPSSPVGGVGVESYAAGINYWFGRNFRASVNYMVNVLSGSSAGVQNAIATNGGHAAEQELSVRLAIAF